VHISAAEAVSAPGFGQRVVRLKTYFDTIIIDAPPIIPVVDGRILADDADQIVLVTTWGKTPRQLVRRAMNLLANNAPKLIGVIINQVDALEHARATGPAGETGQDRTDPQLASQRDAA
jgi:Mrp family chromosome partitioning ATPase